MTTYSSTSTATSSVRGAAGPSGRCEVFDHDLRSTAARRHHRWTELCGVARIDPAVLRRLARLQPAASRRRFYERQLWQDAVRRRYHARHEQFRPDLAHD